MALELKAQVWRFANVSVCLISLLLAGCPRIASLKIYNNADINFIINASGRDFEVKPGATVITEWTKEDFIIRSDFGVLVYSGKRVFSSFGESDFNGPYWRNETLSIQVNPDGLVFVLKEGEIPPLSDTSHQPDGFPLQPMAPNSKLR